MDRGRRGSSDEWARKSKKEIGGENLTEEERGKEKRKILLLSGVL